jgi:hypothetical protein
LKAKLKSIRVDDLQQGAKLGIVVAIDNGVQVANPHPGPFRHQQLFISTKVDQFLEDAARKSSKPVGGVAPELSIVAKVLVL